MIDLIVNMLSLDEFYNSTDNIEIAKGKNKLPMSLKEAWKQFKRKRWQLKR